MPKRIALLSPPKFKCFLLKLLFGWVNKGISFRTPCFIISKLSGRSLESLLLDRLVCQNPTLGILEAKSLTFRGWGSGGQQRQDWTGEQWEGEWQFWGQTHVDVWGPTSRPWEESSISLGAGGNGSQGRGPRAASDQVHGGHGTGFRSKVRSRPCYFSSFSFLERRTRKGTSETVALCG